MSRFPIVVGIQARLGSQRLPGKVLLPLYGDKSMFECIVGQVRAIRHQAQVTLTTSDTVQDMRMREEARRLGLSCVAAPADDIVSRLWNCMADNQAEYLVRVWGDCPFVCPDVIDAMLDHMLSRRLDFLTNAEISARNFPAGLDMEVYSRGLLQEMDAAITDPKLREFPVEYVKKHVPRGKWDVFLTQDEGLLGLRGWHFTVDYPEDLDAARLLYSRLLQGRSSFASGELVEEINRNGDDYNFSNKARNIEYKAFVEGLKNDIN